MLKAKITSVIKALSTTYGSFKTSLSSIRYWSLSGIGYTSTGNEIMVQINFLTT